MTDRALLIVLFAGNIGALQCVTSLYIISGIEVCLEPS